MKKTLILSILALVMVVAAQSNASEINWDALVSSVISVESHGDPNAYNEKSGAVGLMQITSVVLEEYNQFAPSGDIDLYNAFDNIVLGAWYLHRLHEHYGCDTIEKILMAYNAGITRCKKVNFDLKRLPSETRQYVKKVLQKYEEIK